MLFVDDVFTKLSTIERNKVIKMIKDLIRVNGATALIMTDNEDVATMFGYEKKYMVYGSLQDTPEFDINEAK